MQWGQCMLPFFSLVSKTHHLCSPLWQLKEQSFIEKELLECIHIPVLKAFNVKDMEQFEYYSSCPQIAGYVFDAAEPGSGKTFDWSLMERVPGDGKLLLLAGGLCPENVAQALREVKPDGVDVSSGVEYDDMPGKDPEKIMHFVREVRRIDDRLDTGTV